MQLLHLHQMLQFYPVGQGLFACGRLTAPFGRSFSWVFDCGTSSSQGLLRTAVDAFVPQGIVTPVDLIAVSHFDRDHTSGLCLLLERTRVRKLLLPYLPLAQRLALAFQQRASQRAPMGFYINPAEFLIRLFGSRIETIVLVPGSTGQVPKGPPPEPDTREGPPPLFDDPPNLHVDESEVVDEGLADEIRAATTHPSGTRVVVLRQGGALRLGNIFEFVPYNDLQLWAQPDPAFQSSVDKLRIALLRSPGKAELESLKNAYTAKFGRSSEKRNLISLFLYAGPSNSVLPRRGRFSTLYTGDGFLNTSRRLDALVEYLTAARIRRLAVFQVMHHGSRHNWHDGVSRTIAPLASVFSSDPNHGPSKHPHQAVWDAFRHYGRFQVDRRNHFKSLTCFHMRWGG